jgi:hypothetical protein
MVRRKRPEGDAQAAAPELDEQGRPATVEALASAALRERPTPAERKAALEDARRIELDLARALAASQEAYTKAHAVTVERELEAAVLADIPAALPGDLAHERRMRLEGPIASAALHSLGVLAGDGSGDACSQVVFKFFADVLGQVERGDPLPDGLRRVVEVLGLAKGPVLTSAGKSALSVIR